MIKEIRKYYGLSQDLLASYLGITRSRLSMAEIGKRDLRSSSLVTLARLYAAIQPKTSKPATKETESLASAQKVKLKKLVTGRLQDNEYLLKLLQRSLDKMKEGQLRAARVLESMNIFKAGAESRDKGLIDIIEIDAKKLFAQTGEDAQLDLELRIQAIKAETLFLKKKG